MVSPAHVLKHLRDSGPSTLAALADFFYARVWMPETSERVSERFVGPAVEQLAYAGLIRLFSTEENGDKKRALPLSLLEKADPSKVWLRHDPDWTKIQGALSISLTEQGWKQSGEAMIVSPTIGVPQRSGPRRQSSDVFVLMPFSESMSAVYEAVRSVALYCGLSVSRADDLIGPGVSVEEVWRSICSARFIIADCTGQNPNVFYEIGLAHVVGTPAFLITQDTQRVPFDVQHQRLTRYTASPAGLGSLKVKIEATLRTAFAVKEQLHHRASDPDLPGQEIPATGLSKSDESPAGKPGGPTRRARRRRTQGRRGAPVPGI